jgi:hypothetical protein
MTSLEYLQKRQGIRILIAICRRFQKQNSLFNDVLVALRYKIAIIWATHKEVQWIGSEGELQCLVQLLEYMLSGNKVITETANRQTKQGLSYLLINVNFFELEQTQNAHWQENAQKT